MTTVRDYRPIDAEALAALYVASVLELGARRYAPDQVRAWAGLAPSAERLEALMSDGRARLVATDDSDTPLAFADLEPDGHIHFFYAHPRAAGTDAAPMLYEALEARARTSRIERLYAEASETATGFFRRRGFHVLGRRDFEVSGVAIHNHAIEKRL